MGNDQAMGLRRLFSRPPRQTIAVCGTGGTPIAVELARSLARSGRRVIVLDRTVGEVARAMGRRAKYELGHVLDGDRGLAEVLVHGPDEVVAMSAARGLDRVAAESANWEATLEAAVPAIAEWDTWVINGLPPGAVPPVPIVLALNPTAQAITNVYGQIKALARAQGRREFGVVVYDVPSAAAASEVFECVATTARRFLSVKLELVGSLVGAPVLAGAAQPHAPERSNTFSAIAATLLAALSPAPLLQAAS